MFRDAEHLRHYEKNTLSLYLFGVPHRFRLILRCRRMGRSKSEKEGLSWVQSVESLDGIACAPVGLVVVGEFELIVGEVRAPSLASKVY
jgi:hypothetical protein